MKQPPANELLPVKSVERISLEKTGESPRRRDAFASTRDECATQSLWPARAAALAVAMFLAPVVAPVRADLTHDQVTAAKTSTALLVTSTGSGTAFCISESGLFITCDHVLENAKKESIAIVISPTGKDEKRFPATVVRRLKDEDLAVLKVTLDRKVPALKLGDVSDLFETEQLYAFGYPFGKALAVDEKSYPSISVNVGRITALRKKGETLDAIQLDAQVNPGNSGGPVLDPSGNVVGVVSAGVIATGINFAIPVSVLSKGLQTPVITVASPSLDKQQQSKPVEVTVSVDWVIPPAQEPKVAIEVRDDGPPRKIDARKAKDGTFRAEVAPAAAKAVKAPLEIAVQFESGRITGTIADRDISVGGKPKALRSITVLRRAPNGSDFQADGQPAGPLPELKALPVNVGGTTMTIDASKARLIDIRAPAIEIPPTTCKAVVTLADGREFSSEEKLLKHAPASTASSIARVIEGTVDLTGTREISLPSPISNVVAAEDGRVLLLQMKEAKKLAVFDVLSLSTRGYITLADDQTIIAGGAKCVLAVSPVKNLIHRYSLETLQEEQTVSNSFGKVSSLTMGRSSAGIAMMVTSGEGPADLKVLAFDADTMEVAGAADRQMTRQLDAAYSVVRASADGRTFGICHLGSSPTGFTVLTYRDNAFSMFYEHATCGVLVPNDDGSEIFTSSAGVYTDKFVAMHQSRGNWMSGVTYLPSYHPMYYFSLTYDYEPKPKSPGMINIYLHDSPEPLLQTSFDTFKEMESDHQYRPATRDSMTADKRYHFFPQLNLLLTIPPTNNKIIAHSFNVRSLLDKKGIEYLYVTSEPPIGKVSSTYQYKLEAASRAGGTKFKLQSGPAGLTVSKDGDVSWKTPADPVDETVIVSLKDVSGQETTHTFHVVTTE